MKLLAVMVSLFLALPAFAASDDNDEEFFQLGNRAAVAGGPARAFVGARDDQPLEVQATLMQPARGAEGVSVPAAGGGEDAPVVPPASD